MPTIQRQTILSSVFIYTGFIIGALNMAITPFVLDKVHLGFTRVINDFSFVAVGFAVAGMNTVTIKFFPYYNRFLPQDKNDLLYMVLRVVGLALLGVLLLVTLGREWIIYAFGRKDTEMFQQYFWTVYPYIFFGLLFIMAEPFYWVSGKSVLYNLLKENGFRLMMSLMLGLMYFEVITFHGFMSVYAFLYCPAALVAIFFLYRWNYFSWYAKTSKVTRRFGSKMRTYTLFIFATGILTLLVRVCDTLFIAGNNGFEDAAVFIYALYFSQILDVPNRSIGGGATPVLVEYWRVKNMKGIASVYAKSAMNLMIAGLLLGGLIIINLNNAIEYLGNAYAGIFYPTIVLIAAQWVNLSTGLNAAIIHTSIRWRFDLVSTIVYSIISIPLNFFFIKYFGIIGAAMALLVSSLFYNIYRWLFLYRQYRLQPLGQKNVELFGISILLISFCYFLPELSPFSDNKLQHLLFDLAYRSSLFMLAFGFILLKRRYSSEVNGLWMKWSAKLLKPFGK